MRSILNGSKINSIIKEIEGYLRELNSYKPVDQKTLEQDTRTQYAVAFLVEQVANESINLGNHIISVFDLELPTTSKDIFDILAKSKFITEAISKQIKEIVTIRNIIAHRYSRLSLEELVKITNNLDLIKAFLDQIVKNIKAIN